MGNLSAAVGFTLSGAEIPSTSRASVVFPEEAVAGWCSSALSRSEKDGVSIT
jgi:hypothetical protein